MEPVDILNSVKALVDIGIYQSEDQVIQDALIHLMQAHPEYRTKLAIYRYKHEDISLGKTAEIAGVSIEQMKKTLIEHGVQPRLGARTVEEAREEAKILRKYLDERHRQ